MGYTLEVCYGDFSITHSSSDETIDAMRDGSYATGHKVLMAQTIAFIESGAGNVDDDVDDEVAEFVALQAAKAEAEADDTEGDSDV